MEPAVQAATIAGSVALVVAVVGVIATGFWQARATKAAHANALALFERQATEQARLRAREAQERMNLAHLEDRKAAYLKMMIAVDNYQRLTPTIGELQAKVAAVRQADPGDDSLVGLLEQQLAIINERGEALDLALDAAQMVTLVGPKGVSDAAGAWISGVRDNAQDLAQKRAVYLSEVRRDLGVEPGSSGPPEAPERP